MSLLKFLFSFLKGDSNALFVILQRIFGINLVFYDRLPMHFQFTMPLLLRVAQRKRLILLVTSTDHPALVQDIPNVYVIRIENDSILRNLPIRILVTPASHINPDHIPPGCRTVHIFHSLVSMHRVYGDDAFDAFTDLFAVGPHQLSEAASMSRLRKIKNCNVHKVGYPKVDRLAFLNAQTRKRIGYNHSLTIMVAPSWHEKNLLALYGYNLVQNLLLHGYNVIVRPHTHTYDFQYSIIARIKLLMEDYPGRCVLEGPDPDLSSLCDADIMISDWSGVAYEFSFGTERPVLFIDTPPKINSKSWDRHDLPVMENDVRSKIGLIIENIDQVIAGLQRINETSKSEWIERIQNARADYLFNFTASVEVGTNILLKILSSC